MGTFGHLPGLGQHCVYVLRDPDTLAIRYVGRTSNARSRVRQHAPKNRRHARTVCGKWLIRLAAFGKSPLFEVVATVDGAFARVAVKGAEAAITAELLRQGCDLLNSSIYVNGKVSRLCRP